MTSEPDEGASTVRYREAARGYRSLWYTTAVIAVGFGIDLAIRVRGALEHLPGWVLFGGVLLGIQALILYAARATHSLVVTDDELRIGDEVLPLDSITGVVADGERSTEDVPVLGWPGGRPRGIGSIVVRLDDDREVEIPTHHADRLRRAIGVADSALRPGPAVRVAGEQDLLDIPEIDERAEAIFRVAGHDLPRIEFDAAALDSAAAVLVIDDPAVGFAVLEILDGTTHLAEVSVLPGSMRRGMGTALVTAACEWAREHGQSSVTLCTFADIAWNAPFYRRLGFVDLPPAELGPQLRARRERETELGLDAVGRRIVMRLLL